MKALILLLLTGCVAVPPFPPPGPRQATSPQVNNPNCVVRCTVEAAAAVSTDNTAPVTQGSQSQAVTQQEEKTGTP